MSVLDATSLDHIPHEIQAVQQWVNWRNDAGRKLPIRPDGRPADMTNPADWSTFEEVTNAGLLIGFCFSESDLFVGIDLDGCRDRETGLLDPWAIPIVVALGSYAEVSPSQTGVKIIAKGKSPFDRGRTIDLDLPNLHGKSPGFEVYDRGRYFTITGQVLPGHETIRDVSPDLILQLVESLPTKRKDKIPNGKAPSNLANIFDRQPGGDVNPDAVGRCRKYLATLPPAVSGQRGHNQTLQAACELFRFGLDDRDAADLLNEYNARCEPPWDDHELQHKFDDAKKLVSESSEFGCRLQERLAPAINGHATSLPQQAGTQADKSVKFNLLTSSELAGGNYRLEYLIPGVLVKGQPCIVGGPKKCLKTSCLVDLGIALATGGNFLGCMSVPRPVRTLIMSGESGLGTLQETASRICQSAGVWLADCSNLIWCDQLPKLVVPSHLAAIGDLLDQHEIEVLIIDPAYLAMPSADAGNLMAQGELLAGVSDVCQVRGTTLILAHHARKNSKSDPHQPMELEELSWAGFAEFARQWILVNRRERYEPGTGLHKLWLTAGGSAGHSALWAVDIDEGPYSIETPRRWDVSVQTASQVKESRSDEQAARAAERAARKAAAAEAVKAATIGKARLKVLAVMQQLGGPETMTGIRSRVPISKDNFGVAFHELIHEGRVVECTVQKSGKELVGYRLAEESI